LAKTAFPNSGVFDENSVNFILKSGSGEGVAKKEVIY
jgi:hypothetical protein